MRSIFTELDDDVWQDAGAFVCDGLLAKRHSSLRRRFCGGFLPPDEGSDCLAAMDVEGMPVRNCSRGGLHVVGSDPLLSGLQENVPALLLVREI